jgi:hypothetical protein
MLERPPSLSLSLSLARFLTSIRRRCPARSFSSLLDAAMVTVAARGTNATISLFRHPIDRGRDDDDDDG